MMVSASVLKNAGADFEFWSMTGFYEEEEAMPKGSNYKFKLMLLKRIMLEKTDADHYITMGGIIHELEKEEVHAERKTLYRDLADLDRTGIRVKGERRGKQYRYNVVEREFELAELKLLVDAVQASRFISEDRSLVLISKLEKYASEYERKQLNRNVFVHGRVKSMNDGIYRNVDAIHYAILNDRKIKFRYCQWNIEMKLELRRDGRYYRISPWYLTWKDDNYYLIGYDSEAGKVKHYRVDKMLSIIPTEEKREGQELFRQFDLAEYCRKNVNMYDGKEENVVIRIANDRIGVFIDRYGSDSISAVRVDEKHSDIRFEVKLSEQFLGWIFSLGEDVRLVGPRSAVREAERLTGRLWKTYMP